ncbi:transglycosylase SLT domain-containing protein [Streptomyces sp. IB2014 016-6]|uniref:transglycosylase SLT domain-containing protein n=1 Tax=Streptomyces sp. IB2014 016-6 TaxID=2517818 RepID=UPI0011CBBFDD|nr:transglycosylase SLT domain-containing protein [Streptomyces sp. IB2014 016-6]TXL83873.1 lytic transglycosylase domain-containing protein [Streptomyces sp. IB2014 016-6]
MGADTSGQATKGTNAVLVAAGAGTALSGCMLFPLIILIILVGAIVIFIIYVFFFPLVIICDIFGCGGGDGSATGDSDQVAEAFGGDGRGELYEASVPAEFREHIKKAGAECAQIGPIVIASQIQRESMFNEKLVGPDGAEGISQLPPDKFDEFGEDEDDNDETSALDAADSIMAQGKYLCSLAEDIDVLAANNEVKGDRLDLTLAAYHVGLDAVRQAKGVPDHSGAQSYVYGVRSSFAVYSGAVKVPEGSAYPTISPLPLDSINPSPTGGQ